MANTTPPSLCNSFPFLCSSIGILVITIPILVLLHLAVLGICFRLGRHFRDATHRRRLWGPDEEYHGAERFELSNNRRRQTPNQALADSNPSVRMVDMHGAATCVTGSREESPPKYIGHYGSPTPIAGPVSRSPARSTGIASNPVQIPPNAYLSPLTHFRPGSGQLILSNRRLQQRLNHQQHLDDVTSEIEEQRAILMQVARTQNAAAGLAPNPVLSSSSSSSLCSSSSASPPQSLVDFGSPVESSSRTTPSPDLVPADNTIFGHAVSHQSDGGPSETSYGGISEYVWKAVQKEWESCKSSGNQSEVPFSASSMLLAVEGIINWTIRYFTAV